MVINVIEIYSGNIPKDWDANYRFPENGLHPNEQVNMAKKLAKEGKEKDIQVITYSPVMVHALDVYCQLYETEFQAYYCDDNFHGDEVFKVHQSDLWIIFQNLGKCYEIIDEIEIKLMFKDRYKEVMQ